MSYQEPEIAQDPRGLPTIIHKVKVHSDRYQYSFSTQCSCLI
ncbi:MAG: hypothetical protein AAF298_15825 [Cyanobacteria bacterium P01_A01_bin.40]